MVVLDTDVLSLIQDGTAEGLRAQARLRASGELEAITIVTLEEQLRGRVSYCARARTPEQYTLAAKLLRATFGDLRGRIVLDFDEPVANVLRQLISLKIRVGTPDLRIAAIALANNAALITRNLSDFRKVPGLRAEDWTTP
jgi:tRNA(fMet)-specific endonuclease VapC